MASFSHLVARTLPGQTPLADDAAAWWMMCALRCAWPDALAASVLPNHLHLLLACVDPSAERAKLARLAAAFSRHVGQKRVWLPVEAPRAVSDRAHLQRTVRYVHLNPCRSGLVDDPLEWPYSTHRGVVGAVADPWVSSGRLGSAIHFRGSRFRDWYCRYVSVDANGDAQRVCAPQPAKARGVPTAPLSAVVRAAISATPWSLRHVRRLAVVVLARHQGWRDTRLLAQAAGVSQRQIQKLMRQHSDELLSAAALCLGDVRLLNQPFPSTHFVAT